MIILGCNNISLSFGERKILENITFSIQDSDKIGIVGVNGAGKTTLIKIISGIIKPDSGDVSCSKNCRVGYLAQDTGLDCSASIWDELLMAFEDVVQMEKRINQLHENISIEKDQKTLSSLLKEYDSLSNKFTLVGGYEYNSRIKGVLCGLGFQESQYNSKIQTLSGGQRTRISLAKLLLSEPDILLLDEPTNHLDLSALEWLEGFLKSYGRSVIVISHDRFFLDVVTNKTMEVESCECTMYNGNYSEYIVKKEEQREIYQKHYELQQREVVRMENMIEQYKRWNREKSIIAAESKQKALDKIERIDKPSHLPDKIQISFSSRITSGKEVLVVEDVSKNYTGNYLFENINFNISRGEKVFLLGSNGCGKSTLLNIIAGKLKKETGSIKLGHNVEFGYFAQHQEDINESNSIIDEVWNSKPELTQTQVRNALAAFLFKGEDVIKSILLLSGGEKTRVALVKLMLSGANFLILDEPTNHLDINSREMLERALENFNGTILAVSHDRYFISKLATRILEISDCSLINYPFDYSTYVERRRTSNKSDFLEVAQNKVSASKLERINAKEEQARQRKLEKQLEQTEHEILETEERLKEIEVEMGEEVVASDHRKLAELFQEQTSLKTKLENLYEFWDEL